MAYRYFAVDVGDKRVGLAVSDALGITAQFDPSVAQMLASCESVKTYGARPLRREISSKIEDAFSLWMLDGKIREGDHVLLFAVDGKIEYLKLETEKSEA